MKSYSILLGRNRYVTNSAGVVSLSRPTGYYDYVVCPLSNKGDMTLPTPWNYTVHREAYVNGKYVMSGLPPYPGVVSSVEGNLQSAVPIPEWDLRDSVYNLALERLNTAVRGNLDLSVALAEANTTARMFKATARLLSQARRLKPPGGFGSTRDVANGYLQYKYGWKPLLGDIFGVANESIRIVQNKLQRFSAGAKIREERTESVTYSSINGVSDVPAVRTRMPGSLVGCKIGIILEIPPSAFRLDRWMSMNPISIAWELIPYSFVVDWVFDVGSYLRNMETALLYNVAFKSGYVSEIQRVDLYDTVSNFSKVANGYRHDIPFAWGELYHIVFNRRKLASYPLPRRPAFNVGLNSGQLFSAAALLRQLLPAGKRHPRPEPPNPGASMRGPRAGLGM